MMKNVCRGRFTYVQHVTGFVVHGTRGTVPGNPGTVFHVSGITMVQYRGTVRYGTVLDFANLSGTADKIQIPQ